MSLNRSRSSRTSPVHPGEDRTAAASRSVSSSRLGSPVSPSCRESWTACRRLGVQVVPVPPQDHRQHRRHRQPDDEHQRYADSHDRRLLAQRDELDGGLVAVLGRLGPDGRPDLAEQRLHLARADAPDLVGVAAVHGGEQPVGRLQVARMIGQRTVDHGTVRGVAVAGPGQRRDQVDGQLSVRLPYLGARLGEVLQLVGPLGRDGPGGLLVVVGQLAGRRDGPGRPCGGLG